MNSHKDSSSAKDRNVRHSIAGGLIVGVVFVILRLTNVIGWSWWAVTAPLWGIISQLILHALVHALLKGRDRDMVSAFAGISGIINVYIIFLVLQLIGVIDWRWGIIAIPLWVGLALMLLTGFGFAMKRKFADTPKDNTKQ